MRWTVIPSYLVPGPSARRAGDQSARNAKIGPEKDLILSSPAWANTPEDCWGVEDPEEIFAWGLSEVAVVGFECDVLFMGSPILGAKFIFNTS